MIRCFKIFKCNFLLTLHIKPSFQATFNAPLVALGQTSEGCSSYTFPRIFGHGVVGISVYSYFLMPTK